MLVESMFREKNTEITTIPGIQNQGERVDEAGEREKEGPSHGGGISHS